MDQSTQNSPPNLPPESPFLAALTALAASYNGLPLRSPEGVAWVALIKLLAMLERFLTAPDSLAFHLDSDRIELGPSVSNEPPEIAQILHALAPLCDAFETRMLRRVARSAPPPLAPVEHFACALWAIRSCTALHHQHPERYRIESGQVPGAHLSFSLALFPVEPAPPAPAPRKRARRTV